MKTIMTTIKKEVGCKYRGSSAEGADDDYDNDNGKNGENGNHDLKIVRRIC